MKYKIEYINKKTKFGFIGMNYAAAKEHKIPYPYKHPEHTILIYKKSPHDVRVASENHEECEEYFMKNKHYPYHKAHLMALRFENYNKPFPKTQIKYNLKKMGFLKKA